MKLDLGGIDTIEDPTAEDVRHHLKYMPVESPYVVLDRPNGMFVQTAYGSGDHPYRVEYRDGEDQWFANTDYEQAVSIFLSFLDEDETFKEKAGWKKLTVWNTPYHAVAVGTACVIFASLLIFLIWSEVDKWLDIYR